MKQCLQWEKNTFLTITQGPRDLKVTNLPDPVPSKDQYLISIHATATNFFDLLQIRGKYQHQPPLPWVSGSEFSGVVLSTPSSKRSPKFKVGDRVFGAAQGGYATKVCAWEESLRPVPRNWSFLDAAGLFVTAPTSYGALVTRVIATAGTKHKLDVAKSYGADYGVDYGDAKWPEIVKKLTPGGKGVDIVFDPVGMIDKSTKCTAWNGRILVIGFAAGAIEKVAMNKILLKNISVVGLHWGQYAVHEPETVEVVWNGLFELMEKGKFRGTVYNDKEYVGLEAVPEALESLGSRGTWGKVVVKVPQEGASKI
jgi:NADPH2:quinone reductase